MKIVQKLAIFYVCAIVFAAWGFAAGKYKVFPHDLVQQLADFVAGDPTEETSVFQKLMSDANVRPERFIREFRPASADGYGDLALPSLQSRRTAPRVMLAADAPAGQRIIFGAFDFEESFWGAILIGPDGRFLHKWTLSTESLPSNKRPDILKNMYGTAVLPDGSIVFSMQEDGGGLVKVDACSRQVWALEGEYHHTAAITDDGNVWTFGGRDTAFHPTLVLVDGRTGAKLREIDMAEVREKNPDAHIFDMQKDRKLFDATHPNDIDVLGAALAPDFPQFEAGDMLISYATTNMVFVLDPDTLQIKWWRAGAWDRQHDPDWDAGGTISVYANNARSPKPFSDIVVVDPATYRSQVLVDGEAYDFFSTINGTHQRFGDGRIIVTSSTQGRVFELDRAGKVVFEFINSYEWDEGTTLHLSDARFLGEGFFAEGALTQCGAQK